MQPELRHLRYLLAVAEHANFTRAAEELRIAQPTLSQQIKQLEKALGVLLLDRSGRSVRLTDAGEAYAGYARRALQDLAAGERAVLDVHDLSRGRLRLAATPTFTYLTGPLVAAFHARHPGITVEVRELPQDRIEAELLADRLDLGIAFRGDHLPGIEDTALYTETLGLVVGPGHPFAGRTEPVPAEELNHHHLALLSQDFATRRHIDAYVSEHGLRPRIAVEANAVGALTEIVRRTALATVLPDAVTRDHPQLTPVPLSPALPTRRVILLRRAAGYRSAATRAFTDLVVHGREEDPAGEEGQPIG
ncbi:MULTISPECIES: transcriptional regulator CynR [unclassified Streptomyces]|uniref:transcriptional regulator CynR n=1 Tax=unclassified Streptomyces TaxID=2593676 RepID=UPI002965E1DF|nr:transcriptional regulator CynR [Streptomyces sp. SJL17-1]